MMNLKRLAKYTSEDRKDRARYVKVLAMKTGYTPDGLGFMAAKTYSQYRIDADGRKRLVNNPDHYISMITFIDHKLNCHVSCSCGDLCFRWEYANNLKDAGEIEYSN